MTTAPRIIETSTDNLSIRVDGRVAIARLRGEIDGSSNHQLIDIFDAVLPCVSHVDLHLEEVTFMDSAGLHVLLHLRRHAETHKAILQLHNPKPVVQRLLVLTGLSTSFNIA